MKTLALSPRRTSAALLLRPLPSTVAPYASAALRGLDIALLGAAGAVALASPLAADVGFEPGLVNLLLVATLFLPFVLDRTGCYEANRLHELGHLCRAVLVGGAIVFGALFAVGFATDAFDAPMRGWLLAWSVLSLAATLAGRAVFWVATQALIAAGRLRETIVVVAASADGHQLADRLAAQRVQPVEIAGVFGGDDAALAELVKLGQTRRLDKVVIATVSPDERLPRMIHVLKSLAVDVLIAPEGSANLVRSFDRIGALPVIRVAAADAGLAQAA
jgi:hypothetical protein